MMHNSPKGINKVKPIKKIGFIFMLYLSTKFELEVFS